ncbi:hypothetical protein [Nakamurella aerolata]|uniref:Uncharacterized protein n=1 Tax=Nakamurella aerolata TaxID=1656892 RepID=A0A849AAM7_9ACTN|nr:hypothetical protein [Nakamurella aerolata]NNG37569.1 hypothetical protein [Nakamurella aerolata]
MADSAGSSLRRRVVTSLRSPLSGRESLLVTRWVQGICLVLAAVAVLLFLLSQTQRPGIDYGRDRSGSAGSVSGDTRPKVQLPPTAELVARLRADPIVRLPGSTTTVDDASVLAAIDAVGRRGASGSAADKRYDPRVLITPPGDVDDAVRALKKQLPDVIVASGTAVRAGIFEISSSTLITWRNGYLGGDVTGVVLDMLAHHTGGEAPVAQDRVTLRPPTDAELAPVLSAVESGGAYRAPGVGRDVRSQTPAAAAEAFPGAMAFVAYFPPQVGVAEIPDYATALAQRYPERPVLVMYGAWPEYRGPFESDRELVTASVLGEYSRVIDRGYPYHQGVLADRFFQRWADFRHSGMFDRPLPYTPPDPAAVARPALPWVFLAAVLGFVIASVRSRGRGGAGSGRRDEKLRARRAAAEQDLGELSERAVALLSPASGEHTGSTRRLSDAEQRVVATEVVRLQRAREAIDAMDVDDAERQLKAARAALEHPTISAQQLTTLHDGSPGTASSTSKPESAQPASARRGRGGRSQGTAGLRNVVRYRRNRAVLVLLLLCAALAG